MTTMNFIYIFILTLNKITILSMMEKPKQKTWIKFTNGYNEGQNFSSFNHHNTMTRNEDLLPLVKLAYEAFSSGDTVKASAFQAKIDICLKQRGEDPMQFWANFQKAAELIAAK